MTSTAAAWNKFLSPFPSFTPAWRHHTQIMPQRIGDIRQYLEKYLVITRVEGLQKKRDYDSNEFKFAAEISADLVCRLNTSKADTNYFRFSKI
jgi:hypothetical protein